MVRLFGAPVLLAVTASIALALSAPLLAQSDPNDMPLAAAHYVPCRLSFTAPVKSPLAGQYAEMDLPAANIPTPAAQATIEGDTLTSPMFNATDWHVSELAVAFTLVRKKGLAGFGVSDF